MEHNLIAGPKLTEDQRARVLAAVVHALQPVAPELFTAKNAPNAGGSRGILAHLDELVDMVRRTKDDHVEPYLIQILDDVCPHCPSQGPTGYCGLLHARKCAIYQHAAPIVHAIGEALRSMGDPEYVECHGPTQSDPVA